MTKKDKELLLKDLCARLPYGVIVQYKQKTFAPYSEYTVNTKVEIDEMLQHRLKLLNFKPYLRPMSSMTDEELNKLQGLCIAYDSLYPLQHFTDVAKFLHEHFIDFDNLIEKGIALPAPDGMYNF